MNVCSLSEEISHIKQGIEAKLIEFEIETNWDELLEMIEDYSDEFQDIARTNSAFLRFSASLYAIKNMLYDVGDLRKNDTMIYLRLYLRELDILLLNAWELPVKK